VRVEAAPLLYAGIIGWARCSRANGWGSTASAARPTSPSRWPATGAGDHGGDRRGPRRHHHRWERGGAGQQVHCAAAEIV